MKALVRAAGLRLLGAASIRRAALAAAAIRGRALILVYHRIVPPSSASQSPEAQIVPTVTATLFRQQLEALAALGDFVPLAELAGPPTKRSMAEQGRVRFCLTFDDDEPAHAHHTLPILLALGVPATFFLCGRALHGLGPAWWIVLEAQIGRAGVEKTAADLGVAARTAADLAGACEGTHLVDLIERNFAVPTEDALLSRADIALLAAGRGMTIGFHTLAHPVLTQLDDAAVAHALRVGRSELAQVASAPVDLFAYPHGRADSRIARHVADAGFRAACRSGQRPVSPRSNPFLLARWEPGPLDVPHLISEAAMRLNLPPGSGIHG